MTSLSALLWLATFVCLSQAKCTFPSESTHPCECYQNQIHCSGPKIDDNVLLNVFTNISAHTPHYLRHIASLHLIATGVSSISPMARVLDCTHLISVNFSSLDF